MGGYQSRRRWADKFIDKQVAQLADHFSVKSSEIRLSTEDEDWSGIDAIIQPLNITVGLRVRRAHIPKGEIGIRLTRGPDGRNELMKIKQGEPKYMLYCYASPEASKTDSNSDDLELTILVDLSPLRKAGEDWFADVDHHIPHSDDPFMVYRLSDLERYGPTVVATVSTTTTTTVEQGGLKRTTSTTSTAVHPALLEARRKAG